MVSKIPKGSGAGLVMAEAICLVKFEIRVGRILCVIPSIPGSWEDEFPFPLVGYVWICDVSSLEGTLPKTVFLKWCKVQVSVLILLMEEIPNNHLGCINPCK